MKLGRIDKETTANIGKFSGGGATNIVCDNVVLEAEARSLDKEKLQRQIESMEQASYAAAEEMGASAEFNSYLLYPSFKFEDDADIVQMAKRAMEAIGAAPYTFHSGGGSDANVFNGLGVPTINLSVGYVDIHTTKERIKTADLVKVAEIVVSIVKTSANEKADL